MTEFDELINQLKAVLGTASSFNYNNPKKLDDLYEGYLWSEVVRVARLEGWNVSFCNAGPASDTFIFRHGPGLLNSPVAYSFAELDRSGRKGEVHIGVRVAGFSGVLHEFDILVLREGAANYARANRSDPLWNGAAFQIEAKFYSGDVSLGEARSLLGLSYDCRRLKAHLVSRGQGSTSVRQLLRHHGSVYVDKVMPGSTGPTYLQACIKQGLNRI